MVASEKGELNIVRELLEAGVDANAVDNVSTVYAFFSFLLFIIKKIGLLGGPSAETVGLR